MSRKEVQLELNSLFTTHESYIIKIDKLHTSLSYRGWQLITFDYKKLSLRIVSIIVLMIGLYAHFYTLPGWVGIAPHPYWGYDFPLIGLAITGFTMSYYYPMSRKGHIISILVIGFLVMLLIGKIVDDILYPIKYYL